MINVSPKVRFTENIKIQSAEIQRVFNEYFEYIQTPPPMQGWKSQDRKMQDQICRGGKGRTGKHGHMICMVSEM